MNQRIIYPNNQGGVAIVIPAEECGLTIEEIAAKDVPVGKPYKIIDFSEIPTEGMFRNAWEYQEKIVVNIDKCKTIGHEIRRRMAQKYFALHDKVIQLNIPGQEEQRAQAEAKRVQIRANDAACQIAIDAATTTDEIKQAIDNFVDV